MLFIAIGLIAGVLAGLFGIGGGIVIAPALILLARFAPQMATGTSLGALLLPVGALGAWEYYRRGGLNNFSAPLIALGVFFCPVGGGRAWKQLFRAQAAEECTHFLCRSSC